jgi:hypothetical protein
MAASTLKRLQACVVLISCCTPVLAGCGAGDGGCSDGGCGPALPAAVGKKVSTAYDRVVAICARRGNLERAAVRRARRSARVVIRQYRRTPDHETVIANWELAPLSKVVAKMASPPVNWSRDCDIITSAAAVAIDDETGYVPR